MENMQQQFIEAGTLMLAGMVFVFVFLSMLILFINVVLSKLATRFPDPIVQTQSRSGKKTKKLAAGETSPAIVAAISGAIAQYRQKNINK